ncbi:MAG TPA: hypothetical protein VGW38_10785 [Chloroflexota bacterium]|nr:hypothetical protein [Chloroflexota bacterium]
MTSELVQLSNSRGHRYTAADRERAYQTWRISAGRSLRNLAQLSGISHGTLANWSKEERWQDRAFREDQEEAELVRKTLGSVLNDQVLKSIETVVKIRDDEKVSAKDRLNAAQWLAGVAGVAPVQKASGTLVVDQVQERAHQQSRQRINDIPLEDLTGILVSHVLEPNQTDTPA